MIYLDNAATTKLSDKAGKELLYWASSNYFNPSASYNQAFEVAQALAGARERLKKMLGAKTGDIIFTSGATESNNLAIRGSVRDGDWNYIFSAGEHASVLNVAKALQSEGKNVKFIPLTKDGDVDLSALKNLVDSKTRFVSCMFVNSVSGAINDIASLSKIVKERAPRALIHVDGVQAFCKIPFKLAELDVDLFSISAHKFHGPKGVGALYVKNKATLKNMIYGGGQEFDKRSGTENVSGIMAMLVAAEETDVKSNLLKVEKLNNIFVKQLDCEGIEYVGSCKKSPYILTFICNGVNGETLVRMLEKEVVVGRGSACSSKKAGNHVLESMGFPLNKIKGLVRVSFDASIDENDVKEAGRIVKQNYLELLEKVK